MMKKSAKEQEEDYNSDRKREETLKCHIPLPQHMVFSMDGI